MRASLDAPIRASAAVLERILASGRPALVVFEAPGCAPCEALRPVLDELAHEFHDQVLVVRVADSEEGWLAARYHLEYVPTLAFWRGARERSRIEGNPGPAAVRAHLEFLVSAERLPDPAAGPRHTLKAPFGAVPSPGKPRALIGEGARHAAPIRSRSRARSRVPPPASV